MIVFAFVILLFLIILAGYILYGIGYGIWLVLGGKEKVQEQRRIESEHLEEQMRRQREHIETARIEAERRLRALQIADVDSMDGLEFEHYVAKLLIHNGFQARVTKGSGDLGVDIVAQRNERKYAIQVKRYRQPISRRAISDAVAGKDFYHCDSAMVITNSYFTKDAKTLAKATGCELVDRDKLTDWILDFQSPALSAPPDISTKTVASNVQIKDQVNSKLVHTSNHHKEIDVSTEKVFTNPLLGKTTAPLYINGRRIESDTCVLIKSTDRQNYQIEYQGDLCVIEKHKIKVLSQHSINSASSEIKNTAGKQDEDVLKPANINLRIDAERDVSTKEIPANPLLAKTIAPLPLNGRRVDSDTYVWVRSIGRQYCQIEFENRISIVEKTKIQILS